jgi:hypothetical protein
MTLDLTSTRLACYVACYLAFFFVTSIPFQIPLLIFGFWLLVLGWRVRVWLSSLDSYHQFYKNIAYLIHFRKGNESIGLDYLQVEIRHCLHHTC